MPTLNELSFGNQNFLAPHPYQDFGFANPLEEQKNLIEEYYRSLGMSLESFGVIGKDMGQQLFEKFESKSDSTTKDLPAYDENQAALTKLGKIRIS